MKKPNRIYPDGRIILTKNAIAIIDTEDVDRVSKYTWHLTSTGYAATRMPDQKGAMMYLHRFIMNVQNDSYIDHCNHQTLDCRKQNLRICTPAQNSAHQSKRKTITSSKYKGVTWNSSRCKWQGQLASQGKRYAKCFNSEIEAAQFYNKRALEVFGDFAKLNIIQGDDRLACRPTTKKTCCYCNEIFYSFDSRKIYCTRRCTEKEMYRRRIIYEKSNLQRQAQMES